MGSGFSCACTNCCVGCCGNCLDICGCGCCCPYGACACCGCAVPLLLPQKSTPAQQKLRKDEIAEMRKNYTTTHDTGFPVLVAKLPVAEETTFEQIKTTLTVGARYMIGSSIAKARAAAETWFNNPQNQQRPLEAYNALFRVVPDIANSWREDFSFGRTRLVGLNPIRIFQVDDMSVQCGPVFPVTDEMLAGLLPAGVTLASLFEKKRLYMTTSPMTDGLPIKDGFYITAPICLFWENDGGDLMPLAIQLYPVSAERPVEKNPIFTPNDAKTKPGLWLAVKTHVEVSDFMQQLFNNHYISMHLMMESFWVAVCRNLSTMHPLRAFLTPHFYSLLTVNSYTREPGGPLTGYTCLGEPGINGLIQREYAVWSLADHDPEEQCKKRKAMDLKKYYYRDDAMRYFTVFLEYGRGLANLMYPTAADIHADNEFKAFVGECEGFGLRGLPPKDDTCTQEHIARMIARLLYVNVAHHTQVETAGFEYYMYTPQSPFFFNLPPSQLALKDRDYSDLDIFNALPGLDLGAAQVGLMKSVDTKLDRNLYIGNYKCNFLRGLDDSKPVVDLFLARLPEIDAAINARNAQLVRNFEKPYTQFPLDMMESTIWN